MRTFYRLVATKNIFSSVLFTLVLSTGLVAQSAHAGVGVPADDFVTTWKTDNPGTSGTTSITVPMVGGPYNVDWDDDGTFDQVGLNGPVTHNFGVTGTYKIRIRGAYTSISFAGGGDKAKILSLDQWGTQPWISMLAAFSGAVNLQVPATDVPDFSAVTDMSFMFYQAASANPDTSGWNTAAVTNMSAMFYQATSANPDTSGWNTAAVTDMSGMFGFATVANPDTRNWNTAVVTNMSGMFNGASAANPDTSSWNTAAVTNMSWMFSDATTANPNTGNWNTAAVTNMSQIFKNATLANPNTSNWNTAAVTNMHAMFQAATAANPDTSGWNTAAVTIMSSMFSQATTANPDTSSWNTAKVISMDWMFQGATSANPDTSGWNTAKVISMDWMFVDTTLANPDTSNWDTAAVINMTGMFNNTQAANPDTSSWNTAAVTGMSAMFYQATLANPNASNWDTAAVTNMSSMFYLATSFDQDIGSWDVTSLTTAALMFAGVTLSTANYESLLTGWNAQLLNTGVTFSGGNSTYCSAAAVTARANMIAADSWAITDGGQQCPPADPSIAPDLTPASDTGVSDSDNLTSDSTPVFYVACSASGNIITLYTGNPAPNTAIGSRGCTSIGTVTVSVTTALAAGVHNITYTDKFGSAESAHSPSVAITVDTVAPLVPTCFTTPSPAFDGVAVTTTCTGVEELATLQIPNMTCLPTPADATGAVACTGTVGADVGEIATPNDTVSVTDRAGNTNADETTGLALDLIFGDGFEGGVL